MGHDTLVTERLTTDMANGDVVHTLYETIATQFNVMEETLHSDTLFADLGADEHSMEELRTNFEDALHARRDGGKMELILSDFNGAETIGDLIDLIQKSQVL